MSTTVAPPPPAAPTMTVAQMTEKYIALRDKVADINKKQKEQLLPYITLLKRLEGMLLEELNNAGAESTRCEAGTAYKSTVTSATVKDWSTALQAIQETGAWELLEARVSKTAVVAWIEENQAPFPGVAISQETRLNVRRS